MEGRPYSSRMPRLSALAASLLAFGIAGGHESKMERVNKAYSAHNPLRFRRYRESTMLQRKLSPKVKARVRAKMDRVRRNAPGVVYINGRAQIPNVYGWKTSVRNGVEVRVWCALRKMYKTRKYA